MKISIILSKKLNVSIDSLLGTENKAAISDNGKTADTIRSISPHEGVIISVSGVTRSQLLKGGKRSPKYALYAPGRNDKPFIDAQNTFPAWYRDLDDVTREIAEIQAALDAGKGSYTLKYSVMCKLDLFRTIEEGHQLH